MWMFVRHCFWCNMKCNGCAKCKNYRFHIPTHTSERDSGNCIFLRLCAISKFFDKQWVVKTDEWKVEKKMVRQKTSGWLLRWRKLSLPIVFTPFSIFLPSSSQRKISLVTCCFLQRKHRWSRALRHSHGDRIMVNVCSMCHKNKKCSKFFFSDFVDVVLLITE